MERTATTGRPRDPLLSLAAVLVGIAVPLSQIGYAVATTSLAVACVAILLRRDRGARLADVLRQIRSPAGLAVAIVFVCWLPSVLGSIDPAKSLEVWSRTVAYLCLGILISSFLKAEPDAARLCARALIVVALLTVVLIVINFAGLTELIRVLRLKSWTADWAPRTMKHYASPAACLIPVTLYLGIRLGGRWRTACCVAATGLLAFTFLTDSGAGILGAAGAIFFVGFAMLTGRNAAAMLVVWLGLMAASLAGLGWIGSHDISNYRDAASYPVGITVIDPHRQAIWNFTLSQVPRAPWFGHGIDSINRIPGAETVVINPYSIRQELIPSHPHNWLVEILAETGVLGLGALLVALSYVFVGIFGTGNDRREHDRVLARCALFAAFFVSGLFNFSFWASWWQISFIALWAIVSAYPTAAATTGAGSAPAPGRGK